MEYITIIKDDIDLTKSQRYLRLPHPRNGQPQLYLPYTSSEGREGICEVIKLNGANRRTWFIGDNTIDVGSVLIHYEIDPLFLVIPILVSMIATSPNQPPPSFQPFSDLISQASSSSAFALHPPFSSSSSSSSIGITNGTGWNEDISRLLKIKIVRRVMKLACERKVIPEAYPTPPGGSPLKKQVYYRPSLPRITDLLRKKITHFSQPQIFGRFDHLVRGLTRDGLSGQGDELVDQARVKASIEHVSQWLSPRISAALLESYDLTALTTHLANMTAASIAAAQPVVPVSNVKTTALKRKASAGSRGVESLKKVNTSSMAKMTSFFKPKEVVSK